VERVQIGQQITFLEPDGNSEQRTSARWKISTRKHVRSEVDLVERLMWYSKNSKRTTISINILLN